MFRRSRPQPAPTPGPELRQTATLPPTEVPDATRVLTDLLVRPNPEGMLEAALAHAVTLLGGEAQGYAVLRRGQDRVAAVFGYPKSLIGTALSGPWVSARPRLLTEGSRELYALNPPEVGVLLDQAGMRAVRLTLILPLSDRGRTLGALVLDRTSPEGIAPEQQEALTRWAAAAAPLLGLLDSRDEWRRAARQIAAAMVEAVESREFDAVGHGQAVADTALPLGRAVGLAERELEELWYAAMLHDIGKLHDEAGHAQVGANFLHDVPHLAEAQKAIRHHHERWDGQGEPDRLAGEDIPLYARILAVANAYVHAGDLARVREEAGTSLDPRLVGRLEKLLREQ